jgi:flagellar protein FliL
MSTAPAAEAAPAAKGGKKKLIIIIAVAALVLVGGGVAAMLMMKKKSADAEGGEGEAETHAPAKAAAAKHDPKAVPVFVPLDPFTVNLADKDAERFAQVGITLEIEDAHLGDQIKAYTPAIRHNILMAIADRTAAELMSREGKSKLAEKVRKEVSRALGVEVDEDEEEAPEEEAPKADAKKKKKKKKAEPYLPVKAVHFSNFIIQ